MRPMRLLALLAVVILPACSGSPAAPAGSNQASLTVTSFAATGEWSAQTGTTNVLHGVIGGARLTAGASASAGGFRYSVTIAVRETGGVGATVTGVDLTWFGAAGAFGTTHFDNPLLDDFKNHVPAYGNAVTKTLAVADTDPSHPSRHSHRCKGELPGRQAEGGRRDRIRQRLERADPGPRRRELRGGPSRSRSGAGHDASLESHECHVGHHRQWCRRCLDATRRQRLGLPHGRRHDLSLDGQQSGGHDQRDDDGGGRLLAGHHLHRRRPSIPLNASTRLRWSVAHATTASIDRGIGSVSASGGSLVVQAPVVMAKTWTDPSITYTLTAVNARGTSRASMKVSIIPDVEYRIFVTGRPDDRGWCWGYSFDDYSWVGGTTPYKAVPMIEPSWGRTPGERLSAWVAADGCLSVQIRKRGQFYMQADGCSSWDHQAKVEGVF